MKKNYYGLMEKLLAYFGAETRAWPFSSRCCGTFLSVAKPAVVTPMVNQIIKGAIDAKADCIVTACAMCHLNLEIRCTLKEQIPTFHFSEILSLSFALGIRRSWLSSHLVDPRPLARWHSEAFFLGYGGFYFTIFRHLAANQDNAGLRRFER